MEEIQDLAPKMPTPFLRAFFAEKEIPERIFEFTDSRGVWHQVPNAVVVERIGACPVDAGLAEIERILRRIDFANGDVNHFLAHLARGMAEAGISEEGGLTLPGGVARLSPCPPRLPLSPPPPFLPLRFFAPLPRGM